MTRYVAGAREFDEFDGFVRVLRSFLTLTELFLHFGKYKTKKQSAGFFFFCSGGFYRVGIFIFALKLIEHDPISKNIAKIKKVALL